MRSLLRRVVPGALLLSAVVACGDSTAPVAPEHLPIQSADLATLGSRLDSVMNQPVLDMLRGSSAPLLQAARVSLGVATLRPGSELQLRASLTAEQTRLKSQFVPGEAVVPQAVRGLTFVYGASGWAVDTLANGTPRPGAPSNGVRFMLYAISETTGLPTGSPIGYLEVVDNSTSTLTRYITRVVTSAGLTVLQSTTSIGGASEATFSLSQSGFITDGTRRLDQSFVLSATEIRATWSAPFAGVSMEFRITGSEEAATLTWSLTTPSGSIKVVVSATATGAGSAKIYANGALWAQQSWTMDGDLSDSAWQKADGSGPITEADLAALNGMLDFVSAFESLADFDESVTQLIYSVTP